MNKIIQEAIEGGISFTIQFNQLTKKVEYIANGFYKSDIITLTENEDGTLLALARYDEKDTIVNLRDLIDLNHSWWERSKNKFDGWENPNHQWIPLLIKEGFIKEKVQTVTTYE